MRSSRRPRHLSFALAALVALGACDDATTPGGNAIENLDDQAIESSLNDVAAVAIESQDARESLASAMLSLVGMGVQFAPAEVRRPDMAVVARRVDRNLASLLDMTTSIRPMTSFPADVQGETFVYNTSTEEWEIDGSRSGAPANGVRIVYYTTDQFGAPMIPLQEVGYIDLTDEDTQNANGLGVRIVRNAGNVTLADFTQTYSENETSTTYTYSVSVVGFYSDGTTQVDFDVSENGTGTDTTDDITFSLTFDGPDATFTWTADEEIDYSAETVTGEMVLSVIRGGITTALTFTANGDDFENTYTTGFLSHGGSTIANIAINAQDEFVYTKPGGGTFTATEEARIENVVLSLFITGLTLALATPMLGVFV